MVLGLVVALAVALTLHWGISYCRAAIWSAYKKELSEGVRRLASLDKEGNDPHACSNLLMLLDLCPQIGAQESTILGLVWLYCRILNLLHFPACRLGARFSGRFQRERMACTHFAAVVLDQRLASTRQYRARRNCEELARLKREAVAVFREAKRIRHSRDLSFYQDLELNRDELTTIDALLKHLLVGHDGKPCPAGDRPILSSAKRIAGQLNLPILKDCDPFWWDL
jgi:hypothetical protein